MLDLTGSWLFSDLMFLYLFQLLLFNLLLDTAVFILQSMEPHDNTQVSAQAMIEVCHIKGGKYFDIIGSFSAQCQKSTLYLL